MIKENQRTLNSINVLVDALILFIAMPVSFYIRFYLLHSGIVSYCCRPIYYCCSFSSPPI